jgi:hypothetical protein
MVYYLRPRNHNQHNQHNVSYSLGSSDVNLVVPYLVILLLVTVVSTLVILLGVKPDQDCFSFLCVKGDDGKCQVSNVRVVGLSLLIGLLVAGGVFGLNKVNPSLLAL